MQEELWMRRNLWVVPTRKRGLLPMSLAIIANPHAGRGRGQRVINTIAGIISERRLDCELLRTVGPGHAIELALKASQTHETIAVVGGDGTVNEVLRGMW